MKKKFTVPVVLLAAALAAGGLYFTHIRALEKASAETPAAPPPVPIVAGTVAQHDVPIYLTGVGTVIAYNTDIVRCRSSPARSRSTTCRSILPGSAR